MEIEEEEEEESGRKSSERLRFWLEREEGEKKKSSKLKKNSHVHNVGATGKKGKKKKGQTLLKEEIESDAARNFFYLATVGGAVLHILCHIFSKVKKKIYKIRHCCTQLCFKLDLINLNSVI